MSSIIPIGVNRPDLSENNIGEKQDGFLETTPVPLVNGVISIAPLDFTWRLNQKVHTNPGSFSTTIDPAADGFFRTDIIVTDGADGFEKIVGTPDRLENIVPLVPDGKLKVTEANVFGSNVSLVNDLINAIPLNKKLNNYGPDTFSGALTVDGDLYLNNQKNVPTTTQNVSPPARLASLAGGSAGMAFGFCIDASNNIYVAEYASNKVVKITPAGVVTDFATLAATTPIAIQIDATGNLFTLNTSTAFRGFTKITPAGVVSNIVIPTMGFSEHFIIEPAGTFLVSEKGNNKVGRYSALGVLLNEYFVTPNRSPTGIAKDSAGNIFVATDGNNVKKITPAGVITTFATVGTNPQGMRIDASDNIYVANKNSNTVSKISPAGVVTTINVGTAPNAVAVASDGKVYVANSASNNISVILSDNSTSIVGVVGNSPWKLLFDSTGNLFSLDSNFGSATNDVYKIGISAIPSKPQFLTTDENGREKLMPLTGFITQIAGVTLIAANWASVSGLYEYNYNNAAITAATVVDVIPDNASIATVQAAGILPKTVSSAGSVKLYSANLPAGNISVTINIS